MSTDFIRKIRPEDNPAMEAIIKGVMTEYGATGEGYSIHDPEVVNIYNSYQGPGHVFFVCGIDEKVLGGAGIAPLAGASPELCELRKMYFMNELRGRGMGARMLTKCLTFAKEYGYKTCYLETLDRMAEARKLYGKFGFKSLSAPLGFTGHSSCDTYMGLDLLERDSL